jgi:hypothetical protein
MDAMGCVRKKQEIQKKKSKKKRTHKKTIMMLIVKQPKVAAACLYLFPLYLLLKSIICAKCFQNNTPSHPRATRKTRPRPPK